MKKSCINSHKHEKQNVNKRGWTRQTAPRPPKLSINREQCPRAMLLVVAGPHRWPPSPIPPPLVSYPPVKVFVTFLSKEVSTRSWSTAPRYAPTVDNSLSAKQVPRKSTIPKRAKGNHAVRGSMTSHLIQNTMTSRVDEREE